jgi:hypothetical protein
MIAHCLGDDRFPGIAASPVIIPTEAPCQAAASDCCGEYRNRDLGSRKKQVLARGRFPLCLPIEETFRARTGISIKEIQEVIPRF